MGVLSLVASCSSGGSGSEAEGDATPSTTAPTYFARIVVDGVAILVKAVDGYDGTSRFPVDADQMAPLAQEMVARVQER